MIREIKSQEDLSTLVKYGEFFWTKTPYVTTGMKYNPKFVNDLLSDMQKNHYLRVYEKDGRIVGFIGFLIIPFTFNPNYMVATEIFFFVHPEHRGTVGRDLLAKAEEEIEADLITVGDMTSSTNMDKYYTQLGYILTERAYTKVL